MSRTRLATSIYGDRRATVRRWRDVVGDRRATARRWRDAVFRNITLRGLDTRSRVLLLLMLAAWIANLLSYR